MNKGHIIASNIKKKDGGGVQPHTPCCYPKILDLKTLLLKLYISHAAATPHIYLL